MSKVINNYNKEYFEWYKEIGKLGGIVNTRKFQKYINDNDTVLDFGCGGGYLLKNLACSKKHGLEINDHAITEANKNLDKVFNNIDSITLNYYDKIISNNVLQHCENPLIELKKINKLLKKDGLFIAVVSCASRKLFYKPNDINYQLYSWSP
jgi:Ribosomal protein L11 methylase